MKASRTEVYDVLNGERAYQDEKWDRRVQPGELVGDCLVYIRSYMARAEEAHATNEVAEILHEVRKIAALCVVCMETHGAPRREGF